MREHPRLSLGMCPLPAPSSFLKMHTARDHRFSARPPPPPPLQVPHSPRPRTAPPVPGPRRACCVRAPPNVVRVWAPCRVPVRGSRGHISSTACPRGPWSCPLFANPEGHFCEVPSESPCGQVSVAPGGEPGADSGARGDGTFPPAAREGPTAPAPLSPGPGAFPERPVLTGRSCVLREPLGPVAQFELGQSSLSFRSSPCALAAGLCARGGLAEGSSAEGALGGTSVSDFEQVQCVSSVACASGNVAKKSAPNLRS